MEAFSPNKSEGSLQTDRREASEQIGGKPPNTMGLPPPKKQTSAMKSGILFKKNRPAKNLAGRQLSGSTAQFYRIG